MQPVFHAGSGETLVIFGERRRSFEEDLLKAYKVVALDYVQP
jgi:hypothetical protein